MSFVLCNQQLNLLPCKQVFDDCSAQKENYKTQNKSFNLQQQTLLHEWRTEAGLWHSFDSTLPHSSAGPLCLCLHELFFLYLLHSLINAKLGFFFFFFFFFHCNFALTFQEMSFLITTGEISKHTKKKIYKDIELWNSPESKWSKTNKFLLISKASTSLLQMLIKFRYCKNELRERQPYGCSLPCAAGDKWEKKTSANRPHLIWDNWLWLKQKLSSVS